MISLSPTPQEYNKMSQKAAPNSKLWRNILVAFLIGGLICTIGQGIMSWMQSLGLSVGAKMFSIAGPVILYGSAASVIYGLILAIFG